MDSHRFFAHIWGLLALALLAMICLSFRAILLCDDLSLYINNLKDLC
ncbi:hypothetical protein HCCG_01792 [Helicobacter cinaedi CCUG 18818 = ATCC BAA-847]|uniref:Uncharacterized protein n=1 Tax=Helicobacter cinaedi CCUG 18818 = ATCC BAA-847 TaxID=537971 RepID=A0ABN0BCJ7_9HELI|nr:hypothetical protein HCCG_01792 [Helicobacter cinaedi CCUG 18818 = ATCC BAA-847]